jgi:hypothetical protein
MQGSYLFPNVQHLAARLVLRCKNRGAGYKEFYFLLLIAEYLAVSRAGKRGIIMSFSNEKGRYGCLLTVTELTALTLLMLSVIEKRLIR